MSQWNPWEGQHVPDIPRVSHVLHASFHEMRSSLTQTKRWSLLLLDKDNCKPCIKVTGACQTPTTLQQGVFHTPVGAKPPIQTGEGTPNPKITHGQFLYWELVLLPSRRKRWRQCSLALRAYGVRIEERHISGEERTTGPRMADTRYDPGSDQRRYL